MTSEQPEAPSEPRTSAYHEAGHFVAAYFSAYLPPHSFVELSEVPGLSGRSRWADGYCDEPWSVQELEEHGVVALSGPLAEAWYATAFRKFPSMNEFFGAESSEHDMQQAFGVSLLIQCATGRRRSTRRPPGGIHGMRTWSLVLGFMKPTRTRLQENWCHVERVAEALIAQRHLSLQAAQQIIGVPPLGPASRLGDPNSLVLGSR